MSGWLQVRRAWLRLRCRIDADPQPHTDAEYPSDADSDGDQRHRLSDGNDAYPDGNHDSDQDCYAACADSDAHANDERVDGVTDHEHDSNDDTNYGNNFTHTYADTDPHTDADTDPHADAYADSHANCDRHAAVWVSDDSRRCRHPIGRDQ